MKNLTIFTLSILLFLSVSAFSQQTDAGYGKAPSPGEDPKQEKSLDDPSVVPEAMKNMQAQLQPEQYLPAGQIVQTEDANCPMVVKDKGLLDNTSGSQQISSTSGSDVSGTLEYDPQVVDPTLTNPKKSGL